MEREVTNSLSQRLSACYTGAIFDALRSRGILDTILPKEIVPLDDTKTIAGPVFTVRGSPKEDLDAHQSLLSWTEFLSRAPAGHIIVMEGRDDDRALMGELSAETLHFRGVSGFITDGGCRDCDFIRKIGFPIFSSFHTPKDVVGAWSPDAFEEPIRIGDVAICTGDYVIGDIDGVVVIPKGIVSEVVSEVEEIMATENLVRKAIMQGVDPKEAYLKYGRF